MTMCCESRRRQSVASPRNPESQGWGLLLATVDYFVLTALGFCGQVSTKSLDEVLPVLFDVCAQVQIPGLKEPLPCRVGEYEQLFGDSRSDLAQPVAQSFHKEVTALVQNAQAGLRLRPSPFRETTRLTFDEGLLMTITSRENPIAYGVE